MALGVLCTAALTTRKPCVSIRPLPPRGGGLFLAEDHLHFTSSLPAASSSLSFSPFFSPFGLLCLEATLGEAGPSPGSPDRHPRCSVRSYGHGHG